MALGRMTPSEIVQYALSHFTVVANWHLKFKAPVADKPQMLTPDRYALRINLIEEELQEYKDAVAAGDIVEAADALVDLTWVVLGTAVEHGFPHDRLFEEVALSNFSKLGADGEPIFREDGKILKGPGFFKPDIASHLGL